MYSRSSARLIALFALSLPLATPSPFQKRSIDVTTFDNLQLFSQYAAASYCPNNSGNTNITTPITCPGAHNCPLLDSTTGQKPIQSVWEFQNSFWTDVTGYIAIDPNRNLTVLAFRGSHTLKNWLADFDILPVDTDLCDGCQACQGFWLSWHEARAGIMAALHFTAARYPTYKTVVVGHSLGGAIADLAAAELRKAGTKVDLYTYGAPRITGPALSNFITNTPPANGSTYRVTHLDDPVPKIPPKSFGFSDIGPEYWIAAGNGVNVTAADVTMFQGAEIDKEGDGGDISIWDIYKLDTSAHLWYFGYISECDKTDGGDLFE